MSAVVQLPVQADLLAQADRLGPKVGGCPVRDTGLQRSCDRSIFRIFCKNAHIAYFPAYNGIFKISNSYLCIQNIYLCINLQKFAYNRIFPHMRSHFSAFPRILSNVNTRARVIYATYFRNATYMQHIRRIFQHIFRQIPHIFPAYFAPKRPAYFKKNFRYKPVSLPSARTIFIPGELSQWLCHDDSIINTVVHYYYYYERRKQESLETTAITIIIIIIIIIIVIIMN